MSKNGGTAGKHIILLEVIGVGFVVAFIWLTEAVDFPNLLLGHPATPPNYDECLWESAVLIVIGAIFILLTRKLLSRLEYLEGLLHICSFCKKIRVDDEWIPLDKYLSTHTEAEFSHGFCPECGEQHYGKYLNKEKIATE